MNGIIIAVYETFNVVLFCMLSPQEDVAFKQKQKDDKKKMEEAKQAAAKKGPMGVLV